MADANFIAHRMMQCARCGGGFPAPQKPSEAKRRKYCSQECSLNAIHDGLKIPLAQRFWLHVNKGDVDECWDWMRRRDRKGYGLITGDKRETLQAHRVAYTLAGGEIPEGLVVRHKCDNPACCNPSHLEVGTQADNVMDMMVRGRCKAVKVSNEVALQVRADYVGGMARRDIASKYGILSATIKSLVRRGRAGLMDPVPSEVRRQAAVATRVAPRARSIEVDGVTYRSMEAARIALRVATKTLKKRVEAGSARYV